MLAADLGVEEDNGIRGLKTDDGTEGVVEDD